MAGPEDDIEEKLRKQGNLIPEERVAKESSRSGMFASRDDTPSVFGGHFRVGPAPLGEPASAGSEDSWDKPPNPRESQAERAFRAMMFGMLCFPIFFYAIILLFGVYGAEEYPLRDEYRRKVRIASILIFVVAMAGVAWIGIRSFR